MAIMANEEFLKTPTEAKIFEWEVPVVDLATGETLSSATVVSDPTGGSHVAWGTCAISGRMVQSKATGGTLAQDYHVTLAIVTSLGQTLQYCATLLVRAC